MRIHKVRRIGNSNMLALPRDLESAGFEPGADVVIDVLSDGTLALFPAPGRHRPQPDAAAQMTLAGLRKHRAAIRRLAQRFGAADIRVFGSVATGTARPDSDIDLLVRMQRDPGGWAYFGRMDELRTSLEQLLHRPVDLVDEASMRRERFRTKVISEAVPL